MASTLITPGSTDGSTSAGHDSLNLVSAQPIPKPKVDRSVTCKNPDDPYHFTNSLNNTLPLSPPLPASDFPPGESDVFAFDCYIEIPGGIIGFEIKGDIGSDLSLVFQTYVDIWPSPFPIDLGVFRCSLLDVEKDPCIFNINTKVLNGQAGIFPEQDADPTKLDLCVKVQATLHVLFKRSKSINFEKCFLKFDKPDDIATDALVSEPVLSNSTVATA